VAGYRDMNHYQWTRSKCYGCGCKSFILNLFRNHKFVDGSGLTACPECKQFLYTEFWGKSVELEDYILYTWSEEEM
jgi:hypothetical protein